MRGPRNNVRARGAGPRFRGNAAEVSRAETGVRAGHRRCYVAGMADSDGAEWRELNRANWDDRVPVHLASEFYDLDAFRDGADPLRAFESGEARDVAGRPRIPMMLSLRATRPA